MRAFISVGSNLGQREFYLRKAKEQLRALPEIKWLKASSVYETEPVGGPPQSKFLNAVWEIETNLTPTRLLEALHTIEKANFRTRREKNEPRTLDLDILLFDNRVINEAGLKVPHPELHKRFF